MDDKAKNRAKHLRRRLRNGKTISPTDAQLLRSMGHEVKESTVEGFMEHGTQGDPAAGVDSPLTPSETLHESPLPPPEVPPPLGPPPAEVLPRAEVPVASVELSPAAVAEIATNLCKGMAKYSAEQGMLALPNVYWDQVFKPACEAVLRQYAPRLGEQAAAPVVVGSAAFQATQATRAYFAARRKQASIGANGNGVQGEPATAHPPARETSDAPSFPTDAQSAIFGKADRPS